MSKILLVYDDFAELTAIDYSLKKVGFDVIALTNEFTIKDQIIAFNPEILVCSGSSSRVSTLSVGKKLKEMTRWQGKSILIFPPNYEIPADDLLKLRMDMMLETPVPLTRLIQIIAKITGQDDQIVIDKLVKSFVSENSDQNSYLNQDESIKNAIHHIQGQVEKDSETKINFLKNDQEGAKNQSFKANDQEGAKNQSFKANDQEGAKNQSIKANDQEGTKNQSIKANDQEGAKNQSFKSSDEETRTSGKLVSSLNQESSVNPVISQPAGSGAASTKTENLSAKSSALSSNQTTPKKSSADPFLELVQELSGQKPVAAPSETQNPAAIDTKNEALEDLKLNLMNQLQEQKSKMPEKNKKYLELTQNITLYPESMLKKVKVRKQFNQLKKDWDKKDLADQDGLRKEFVKALFKKK